LNSDQEKKESDKPYKRSSGAGIAIGLCLGSSIGLLIDNLAIGVSLGLVFGIAIDSTIKKK